MVITQNFILNNIFIDFYIKQLYYVMWRDRKVLTKIKLKNFKVFDDISIDLADKKGKPLKYVFLYGENGAGKSSILKSISFLEDSLTTLTTLEHIEKIISQIENDEKNFPDISLSDIISRYKMRQTIDDMAKRYRMIDSNDDMILHYSFFINEKKATYELIFNQQNELVKEVFGCVLDKRIANIFTLTKNDFTFNRSLFKSSKYKKELIDLYKRYWGKHTFASILIKQIIDNNSKYMNEQIDSNVFNTFYELVIRLIGHQKDVNSSGVVFSSPFDGMGIHDIDSGEIDLKDEKTLDTVSLYIKEILTNINSTISNVFYEKKLIDDRIKYSLQIEKIISNKKRTIPYNKESTGTKNIIEMLPFLIQFIRGNVCIMDEIDSGIHDLLFENLISDMMHNEASSNFGQLIASTHNTKIIHSLDAHNTFLILVDGKTGKREIKTFADLEVNHRSDNNYEVKYLNDKYGGLPPKFKLDYSKMIE